MPSHIVAMLQHLAHAKAAKSIAKAASKSARAAYKADKKVAEAVEDALRHKAKYAENPVKAAKVAARDAEDISEAIAHAKVIKMKAKVKSMHIVAKGLSEMAEMKLAAGSRAAVAVGAAALNDAAMFGPLLAGLAPAVLPALASGLAGGPAGLQAALGGAAAAIGKAVLGDVGAAGPELLAGRIADILPGDLLSGLADLDVDLPVNALAGLTGSAGGIGGIVAGMPPQVLDVLATFLGGAGGPYTPNAFAGAPGGDLISLPPEALRELVQALGGAFAAGGAAVPTLDVSLPGLPPAGLPLPLKVLSNILGVLPRPDLLRVFRTLPRPPLMQLLGGLPFGLRA